MNPYLSSENNGLIMNLINLSYYGIKSYNFVEKYHLQNNLSLEVDSFGVAFFIIFFLVNIISTFLSLILHNKLKNKMYFGFPWSINYIPVSPYHEIPVT